MSKAADRQLGLPVIAALASRVEVVRTASGKHVRMSFPYPVSG